MFLKLELGVVKRLENWKDICTWLLCDGVDENKVQVTAPHRTGTKICGVQDLPSLWETAKTNKLALAIINSHSSWLALFCANGFLPGWFAFDHINRNWNLNTNFVDYCLYIEIEKPVSLQKSAGVRGTAQYLLFLMGKQRATGLGDRPAYDRDFTGTAWIATGRSVCDSHQSNIVCRWHHRVASRQASSLGGPASSLTGSTSRERTSSGSRGGHEGLHLLCTAVEFREERQPSVVRLLHQQVSNVTLGFVRPKSVRRGHFWGAQMGCCYLNLAESSSWLFWKKQKQQQMCSL